MIENLPTLDDLEPHGQHEYQGHQGFMNKQGMPPEGLNKYIRQSTTPVQPSGMGYPSDASSRYTGSPEEQMLSLGGYSNSAPGNSYGMMGEQPRPPQEQMQQPPMEMYLPPPTLNCLDVNNHIKSCPICSRFYKHDNTMYVIVIVILAVICLLLLKRVLNV